MSELVDDLERLAALLEKGLITREQFDQQRDALMAGKEKTKSDLLMERIPPALKDIHLPPQVMTLAQKLYGSIHAWLKRYQVGNQGAGSHDAFRPDRSQLRLGPITAVGTFSWVWGMTLFAVLISTLDHGSWRLQRLLEDGEGPVILLLGAPLGIATVFAVPRIVNAIGRRIEPTFHRDCGPAILDALVLPNLWTVIVSMFMKASTDNFYELPGDIWSLCGWGVTIAATLYAALIVWRGVRCHPGKWLVVVGASVAAVFAVLTVMVAITSKTFEGLLGWV